MDYDRRLAISAKLVEQLRVVRAEYDAAGAHFGRVVADRRSFTCAVTWKRFAARASELHGCAEAILRLHAPGHRSERRAEAKLTAPPPSSMGTAHDSRSRLTPVSEVPRNRTCLSPHKLPIMFRTVSEAPRPTARDRRSSGVDRGRGGFDTAQ
jgi:hypothetical protein